MNTSKHTSKTADLIRSRGLPCLAVALGLLLRLPLAHAADGKVYPGATCVADTWGTWLSRDNSSGSVTVDYTTTLWCPLLGDSEDATTAGLDVVRVQLWEGNVSAAHTKCTAYSYTSAGVLFDSNSATAKTWSASQTLSLPLTKANGPSHPRYLLKCALSGPGTLNEYEIEEQ